MTTHWFRYILDIFYPNRCPCCMKVIRWDRLLCEECLNDIKDATDEICTGCGKKKCICNQSKSYDKCFCYTYYEGKARDGIINLKLNNGINFAQYCAEKLCPIIEKQNFIDNVDFVTYVPTTRRKKLARGYNQAEIFAKYISDRLGKKLEKDVLIKTDKKLSQHTLSAVQRRKQVRGAFRCSDKSIDGSTAILCDDIITTGSTLNECALQLKNSGVKQVICITMATSVLKL